jgi:hypothetical protein
MNKKKNKHSSQDEDQSNELLNEDQINQRIAEIEDLEYQKRQEEKKYEKLIKQVEGKIKTVEHDREIWLIKLKEKEQEYRLNELRIKELKRQVPHKALKPLPKDTMDRNSAKLRSPEPKPAEQKTKAEKSPIAKKNVRTAKEVSTDIRKEHDSEIKKASHGVGSSNEVNQKDLDEPSKPKKDNSNIKDKRHITLPPDNEENDRKEEVKDRSFHKQESNKKPSISRKDSDKSNDESEHRDKRQRSSQSNEHDNDHSNSKKASVSDLRDNSRLSNKEEGGFYDNSFSEDEKQNIKESETKQTTNTKSKPFGIAPKRQQQKAQNDDDEDDYKSD